MLIPSHKTIHPEHMLGKKQMLMEIEKMIWKKECEFQITDQKLLVKLTDVMLQEKLITPEEKVKLLKLLKEGAI